MRRGTGLGAALAAAALLLSGCILYPGQHLGPTEQTAETLGGARFWQEQAVPGFDGSTYTLSEDQVEQFRDLLRAHDVEPGSYRTRDTEGCTGGIRTRAQLWFHGNGDKEMIIDGCGAPEGSFDAEATAFFSAIREGNAPSEFPNAEIVALVFSQSQAVEGFDDAERRQDDPAEVARFRELVDAAGLVWSDIGFGQLAGDPCPGSIVTTVHAEYAGTDLVVGPTTIGGCDDDPTSAALTDLFSEWRAGLPAL